jgi:hypothetical protein
MFWVEKLFRGCHESKQPSLVLNMVVELYNCTLAIETAT